MAAEGRHSQGEETAPSGQEPLGMVCGYWLAWPGLMLSQALQENADRCACTSVLRAP